MIAAIAAWSDGLSRATHVQIAPWVTALRRFASWFWAALRGAPIGGHSAAAVGASSRHSRRCACRIQQYSSWLCAQALFLRYFFIAAIPRRPDASDAVEYATRHLETSPEGSAPRRHDANARALRDDGARRRPHPSARAAPRGCPNSARAIKNTTRHKTHKTTLEHRRHVLERIDGTRRARTHDPTKLLVVDVAVPFQVSVLHERLHELVGGPRP